MINPEKSQVTRVEGWDEREAAVLVGYAGHVDSLALLDGAGGGGDGRRGGRTILCRRQDGI